LKYAHRAQGEKRELRKELEQVGSYRSLTVMEPNLLHRPKSSSSPLHILIPKQEPIKREREPGIFRSQEHIRRAKRVRVLRGKERNSPKQESTKYSGKQEFYGTNES